MKIVISTTNVSAAIKPNGIGLEKLALEYKPAAVLTTQNARVEATHPNML